MKTSLLNQAFSNILVVKNRKTGTWVPKKRLNRTVRHWSEARLFSSIAGVKNALGCSTTDSKNQPVSKERREEWFKDHYQIFQFDAKTGDLVELK